MLNISLSTSALDQVLWRTIDKKPITYAEPDKKGLVKLFLFENKKPWITIDTANRFISYDNTQAYLVPNFKYCTQKGMDEYFMGENSFEVNFKYKSFIKEAFKKVFKVDCDIAEVQFSNDCYDDYHEQSKRDRGYYQYTKSHSSLKYQISTRVGIAKNQLTQMAIFDEEVLDLIVEFGFTHMAGFETYNVFWQLKERLQECLEKLPIATYVLKKYIIDQISAAGDLLMVNKIFKVSDVDLLSWAKEKLIATWKLAPKDWKTLLSLRKTEMQWFIDHSRYHRVSNATLLHVKRETGKFPRISGIDLLEAAHNGTNRPWYQRLIEQALIGSQKAPIIRQWANNELYQVLDWWDAEGYVVEPDKNQLTMTWNGFLRHSERYHDRIAKIAVQREIQVAQQVAEIRERGEEVPRELLRKVDVEIHFRWDSAIRKLELPEQHVKIMALTSAIDLAIEGHSMHHCVKTYARRCLEVGDSRIFSILELETGNRIATCQIVQGKADGRWRLEQVRGKRNAEVTPEIKTISNMIALAYTEAHDKLEKETAQRIKEAERIAREEALRVEKEALEESRRIAREARELERMETETEAQKMLRNALVESETLEERQEIFQENNKGELSNVA